MTKKTRNFIIGAAIVQILAILFVANMPYLIENYLPGEYWDYLPERLIATMGERGDYVPAVSAAEIEVNAADLLAGIPQVLPTAAPSETPAPDTPTPAPAEADVQDETPTVEATATEPPPTPSPTPSPPPAAFRIDGLVNEPQKFNNCGPTNLALVLQYYGDPTTQLEAAAYLKPNNQDRNVSPWQISDYVNEFTNLKSITRANGTHTLLKRLIAANFPVVIEKGYDPNVENARGWYGHYLTVFGYNDEKAEYYTMDTFLGPFTERDTKPGYTLADGRPYSYDYIAHYWQQFEYTFYVVYPPEREQELLSMLGPELLDDVTMWTQSAARAQKELEEDPENPFSWFNVGTALTRLGEITGEGTYYQNASTAFDKAFSIGLPSRMIWYQHKPYVAYIKTGRYEDAIKLADNSFVDPGGRTIEEAYKYKGDALSFLGDFNGAARAYEEALKLNGNFYPAQIALDYVNTLR